MANPRQKVIAADVNIDTSWTVSTVADIEGWAQLGVEIDFVTRTGSVKVVIELGPDENSFYPETIEDGGSASLNGNDLEVPMHRHVRTWGDDGSMAFQIPCGGYKRARISVTAGTSANINAYINRLRLSAN